MFNCIYLIYLRTSLNDKFKQKIKIFFSLLFIDLWYFLNILNIEREWWTHYLKLEKYIFLFFTTFHSVIFRKVWAENTINMKQSFLNAFLLIRSTDTESIIFLSSKFINRSPLCEGCIPFFCHPIYVRCHEYMLHKLILHNWSVISFYTV